MIIAAKYALLEPGVVRQDVRIEFDGPRLLSVNSGHIPSALSPDVDFGMAVITPGLVNPHAHLELEFCAGKVPYNGNFTAWLQHIRDIKIQRGNQLSELPIASLRQLSSTGCTTVVDHHTVDMDWIGIETEGLNYFPMREVFEFNNHAPSRERLLTKSKYSWAPHAPYTASREIMRKCRELADEFKRPLSIHVSEYRHELSFIETGCDKEIEELHNLAGTSNPDWFGVGHSPVRYLAEAEVLTGRTFAIHVNYLEPGDLELLAEIKPTIVYCPRSHRFFKHEQHPLEQYIAASVPVALGTDSLASNEWLSLLNEAALVRELFPSVSAETVFKAITTAGLEPLGLATKRGRLEPGYYSDLAVFPFPADPGKQFDRLFDAMCETQKSAFTVVNGRVIHNEMQSQAQQAI